MKINGTMTTSTIKPRTFDKEGFPKNPEYLAITFKTELDNLSDEELGQLLSLCATGEELEITVDSRQPRMSFSKPGESGTEPEEPSVEAVNALVDKLRKKPEYEDWSLVDLSQKAREILKDDIPF